jgi:hyaluronoglucosaminidase
LLYSAAVVVLALAYPAFARESPFPIRGIKGLWWDGFAKYDQALPWIAKHNMNFLMFCYTSFPASGTEWRADYTPEQIAHFREMAKQAKKLKVGLCLSFNPGIWSKPPLSYCSESDYQYALRKVKTTHATGIRWFALCLDDINRELLPEDVQRYGTLQTAQVHFVNRLWGDMKRLKPEVHLIFCPSAYTSADATAHPEYTKAVGEGIDPDVMLFWTGPEVCSATITANDAWQTARLYHRRPFVWDNYPVNDMFPWRPLLAPVKGRSADLSGWVSGYIGNPMKQWSISRIPLATLAAYFRDPKHYNPQKAIAASIAEFPVNQRPAIRLLVATYGSSFWGDRSFPPKPVANTVLEAKSVLPQYERLKQLLTKDPKLVEIWADVQPTVDADIASLRKTAGQR